MKGGAKLKEEARGRLFPYSGMEFTSPTSTVNPYLRSRGRCRRLLSPVSADRIAIVPASIIKTRYGKLLSRSLHFLFDHSNTLPEVAWKAIGNRTLNVGGYIRFTGYLTRSGQALRDHWKSSPRQYPSVSAFIIIAHLCTHEHGESITTPKK
nr:hypothetical protein [Paenibacillus polymyxa]